MIFTGNKLLKPVTENEANEETPDSKNRIINPKPHNVTGSNFGGGGANYETDAMSNAPRKQGSVNAVDKSSVSGVFSDDIMSKKNGGNQSSI